MGALRGFGAAAATIMSLCVAAEADPDGANSPSLLLFSGNDLWRASEFLNGGLLWSPGGLDNDGFTLKVILTGGLYTYPSGGLHTDVDGSLYGASALPGLRITTGGITIGLYGGPIIQDYRLTPFDSGSLLHGFYTGAQLTTDVWYQPSPTSMLALDGSVASIAAMGAARAAIGWRLFEPFFVGPEAQALWCLDYQQWRLGAHITGFRIDGLEWTAAAGMAADSLGRSGPYLRLGVFVKY